MTRRAPRPSRSRSRRAPAGKDRREDYRGPQRFRSAGAYEVDREWNRYEGTPQRDLLRAVREDFLQRSLRRAPAHRRWSVEVGPGPGRFSPFLLPGTQRLVLADLSAAMLRTALQRLRAGPPRPEGLLADGAHLPIRPGTADVVVALGNVAGFAEESSLAVLSELCTCVGPSGMLVVETTAARTAVLRFPARLSVEDWRSLLRKDPQRWLPDLLRQGSLPVPESSTGGREPARAGGFQYLGAAEVARFLEHDGLRVREQLVSAPLTGDDPHLVERLYRLGPGGLTSLLRWERAAGSDPGVRTLGGHLLTCATRD